MDTNCSGYQNKQIKVADIVVMLNETDTLSDTMARLSASFKRNFFDSLVTLCFIFFISVNFYVNVWVSTDKDVAKPLHRTRKMANRMYNVKPRYEYDNSVTLGQLQPPRSPTTTPVPLRVWPSLRHFDDDRILQQLNFTVQQKQRKWVKQRTPLKKILLFHGFKNWEVKRGQQTFLEQKCAVNTCILTDDRRYGSLMDAVLFKQFPSKTTFRRPPNQIWIYFMLEPPYVPIDMKPYKSAFNWTATYRRDSDIVAPYEKFVLHNAAIKTKIQNKDYAAGKTKKVAWFVSNCQSANKRIEYARELSKYIQVDVYGRCGRNKCNRGNGQCTEMLNTDYKFYLAFENSNCRDYITEKFFSTGLQ